MSRHIEQYAEVPDKQEIFKPKHLISIGEAFLFPNPFTDDSTDVAIFFEGYTDVGEQLFAKCRIKDEPEYFELPIDMLVGAKSIDNKEEVGFEVQVQRSSRKSNRIEGGWTLLGIVIKDNERFISAGMTDGTGTHYKLLKESTAIKLNVQIPLY